jgi:ABC-type glycerol-3-phosphate transport system permease component
MYEHKKQPLAPKSVYYRRLWKNFFVATFVLLLCLLIGVMGYKLTVPEFDWYDSLLNASMILSGMGPVIDGDICLTRGAKVFASCYALFSGVMFISTIGILIAPIAHRFFHRLNLEDE